MRRFFLAPLILALSSPAFAENIISKEVHNACKDVKDYKGCVEARTGDGTREWTRKDGPPTIFHPDAVVAMKIRGEYGRYLTYRYYRLGQDSEWSADADCEDYTVNWKGDREGWKDISKG